MDFEQAEDEQQQAVRREAILPVDRDRAWAALCDADGLASWLADEVDLDVREGAEGTVRWRSGEERAVVVEEVMERRLIALRWHEAGGEESLVELTLDDVAEGTRLVVVELPLVALRAVAGTFVQSASNGQVPTHPQMLAMVG
ncbi:MAG TPA: SRPBCC domain-containing protein [Solirubrobacteraceae bacterium]